MKVINKNSIDNFKKCYFLCSVHSTQHIEYSVAMIRGILDPENSSLAIACGIDRENIKIKNKRLVVIDDNVYSIYGEEFREYFSVWGFDIHWKIIKSSEINKNIDSVMEVATAMIDAKLLRRGEVVIGIGGGVLLDIVGFASSLYRRGIPYVRIPTTLMGQIDAGIGIKTGVNYAEHKNRLGTYFPPVTTLIDPCFLRSLTQRHITNGVAEIIKIGLIKDSVIFELLEAELSKFTPDFFSSNDPVISEIMSRSIVGMLTELESNLWEADLYRCVDYGHTFSPSLELRANPPLLHGEAVAVDMALCIAIAHQRKLLTEEETCRALLLMRNADLLLMHPVFNLELLEEALSDAVKHRDGLQRIPLTDGIGHTRFVNDVTKDELANAIDYIVEWQQKFNQVSAA